jgi:hypothetical protein
VLAVGQLIAKTSEKQFELLWRGEHGAMDTGAHATIKPGKRYSFCIHSGNPCHHP